MSAKGNKKTTHSQSKLESHAPARLSCALHRSLSAYALAAGAAGVAVLACSAPAEAAPVCKNLDLILFGTSSYALNPGGQMIAPFNIVDTFNNPSSNSLGWWNRAFFTPNSAGANAVVASNKFAADLPPGASIGPAAQFGPGRVLWIALYLWVRADWTRKIKRSPWQFPVRPSELLRIQVSLVRTSSLRVGSAAGDDWPRH